VALMILLQMSLKARHPPGAATALLITLGGFEATWHDAIAILVGITIVTITGELARRLHRPH
jgi:CBS-domain-containing membrane protein